MEDRTCCICSISFEDQSLKETGNSEVYVGEIMDGEILDELKIVQNNNCKEPIQMKGWNSSCDPVPVKYALEIISQFLTKTFNRDKFYFVFFENEVDLKCSESDCDRNNSFIIKSDCKDSTRDSNSSAIFGSPLKLQELIPDFSVNEKAEYLSTASVSDQKCSQIIGLSIHEARKILSKFSQIKQLEQRNSLLKSMVVLCNGEYQANSKDRTIVLLGAHRDIDESNQTLITFKVTFSNKKHSLSFLEPLNLDGGVGKNACPMQCSYNLLEQRDRLRRLWIEAHWTNCLGNSVIFNLHTAQFTLHVTAPFGIKESPLYKHLSQLKHVLVLCKGLKDGELPSVLSTKQYNAQEKLQDLFLRIKNGEQDNLSPICKDGRGKKINLGFSYSTDVTDQLWEIFAQCESYQDLVKCLSTTFKFLKKNEFPLYVHNNNDTMLARLIHQSSSGLINYPPLLSNLMPLKIVAELGLERMKKVYASILMQNDLCSSADVDGFLKECLKEDSNINLSESSIEPDHQITDKLVDAVKKLHHCVDLVCLVDLHTTNINLRAVASHMLNHYRVNGLDESFTFLISLDTRQASQEVEKLTPCMVRREYKIEDRGHVECFLSDLPEALSLHSSHVMPDNGENISGNFAESKECFKFMTEESVRIVRRSS